MHLRSKDTPTYEVNTHIVKQITNVSKCKTEDDVVSRSKALTLKTNKLIYS